MTQPTGPGPLLARDRRARIMLPIGLVLLVGLTLWRVVFSGPQGPRTYEFTGETMGTTYLVKVAAPSLDGEATGAIDSEIGRRLDRVNRLLSTWDPQSEISRFNRARTTGPFPVDEDVLYVVRTARRVSEAADGAFDITIGPLVRAWGFAGGEARGIPHPDTLAAAAARVGYRSLRTVDGALIKDRPDLECDVSAIAKGFGVDEVARGLEDLGHGNYLVEIGGEIRVGGVRPDGEPWHLAIESPGEGRRRVHDVITVSDAALATSGDYRNYREEDGRRVSHLVDPRTRQPVTHRLASVSVVHEDCTRADAWATALIVLGPAEGLAVARRENLAAYFILRDPAGDGFLTRETDAFRALRDSTEAAAGA